MNFKHHIRPYIGDIKLKDLRNDIIQRAINDLIKNGVPAYTIKDTYKTFHSAMEQAVENDLISKNFVKSVSLPDAERKPSRALTPEEQIKIIELAGEYTGGDIFLMPLATGMRISEVLALTWDDIDWENKTVSVDKTLTYVKDPTPVISGIMRLDHPRLKAVIEKSPSFLQSLSCLIPSKLLKRPAKYVR